MLVDAQVSSIKTSLSGSRSSCPSNHSSRRFRTSGRSCSVHGRSFFACDSVATEEAPQRRDADAHVTLREHDPQLRERRIRLLFDRFQDKRGMILDLGLTAVAALRLGGRRTMTQRQLPPPDCARCADTEPLGGTTSRHQLRRPPAPEGPATALAASMPASSIRHKARIRKCRPCESSMIQKARKPL